MSPARLASPFEQRGRHGRARGIGPQPKSDAEATARHRFHQSWYRAFVLGVPAGIGPGEKSGKPLGSMLRPEEGAAGSNFLTSEIAEMADARIAEGGTVEPFRARHNLLSSQPLCFNLFGPLARRPDLAAAFVAAVTGRDIAAVSCVTIEDSPGHLGDRTGLDASIRYETTGGASGVLGIETKLTERFSPKRYELDSMPAYRKYSEGQDAPFRADRLEELTDPRWNQLWRNQMLCEAIKHHEERDHAEQVVVFPDDMTATAGLVADYAALLTRLDAVRPWTLSQVVAVLSASCDVADQPWLDRFRTRYIDLDLSTPLYDACRAGRPPFDATVEADPAATAEA